MYAAPVGPFRVLEIVAGQTVDVPRCQAIPQQTDRRAETAERSVPSAHDCATLQTAETRRAGREDTR
jgi:hypothetical protein